MHKASQIVSEVSVQEAVENGIGYGGDEVGVEDDDIVVGNKAVGHEEGGGESRDENHRNHEKDHRHSNIRLRETNQFGDPRKYLYYFRWFASDQFSSELNLLYNVDSTM